VSNKQVPGLITETNPGRKPPNLMRQNNPTKAQPNLPIPIPPKPQISYVPPHRPAELPTTKDKFFRALSLRNFTFVETFQSRSTIDTEPSTWQSPFPTETETCRQQSEFQKTYQTPKQLFNGDIRPVNSCLPQCGSP
jgi:hypothetical protein